MASWNQDSDLLTASESPSKVSPPSPYALSTVVYDDEDPFLAFVERARPALCPANGETRVENEDDPPVPPWSWIVSRILKTCAAYSSGVTPAILLSDLFQSWSEQHKYTTSKKRLECMIPSEKRHKRTNLINTVTIDSIYEKYFLPSNCNLEAVVLDSFFLPGTNIRMIKLGDFWSSSTIDMYLHRRYYHLVDKDNGIIKQGREVFLTGCSLHTETRGGVCHPRLLPTEYLVILLNEDEDDDAMLLGAQFCSDNFSSIRKDSVKDGSSYSLYARIESIGELNVIGSLDGLQRKKIVLIDNDGSKVDFFLWGDQVLLASLLSIGSMVAIDRPYIAEATDSDLEICLEYGSATQLYLVPFIQHEEQVLLASTQIRHQRLSLTSPSGQTQEPKVSQVSLPLDSQGSVDFRNYPFQTYVSDVHDRMTGISLYGVVGSIVRADKATGTIFYVVIKDTTGEVEVTLHFTTSWSLGRLDVGHLVFIKGLACRTNPNNKKLEISWVEKDPGVSLVDLSCLPALLNSSCLHRLSPLSDIFGQMFRSHVCSVRLDRIRNHHVLSVSCHVLCGRLVENVAEGQMVFCSFCGRSCQKELVHCFCTKLGLIDETGRVFAWCRGQTAAELLQISSDEFFQLPEDEQAMYLYTLEDDRFMVNLSCSRRPVSTAHSKEEDEPSWEIVRVQKCS